LAVGILAAVVIGFSALKLGTGNGNTDLVAVIKHNDNIVRTINLSKVQEPERIEIIGEYSETVLVEKGRIRFEEADCPDLVCVKTGWLTKPGDTAVCLPNRVIIKIEGQNDEIDGVIY